MTRTRVILASASPQRTRLLHQLGVAHTAIAADIDESRRPGEPGDALAERLARSKAEALATTYPDAVIIGSDTVVAGAGQIYGKPSNVADATAMLRALQGKSHRVVSGVAVLARGRIATRVCVSEVAMCTLNEVEIATYLASGEPFGKAGAYAIQGRGALFVARLAGSYSAVMGLPLYETGALLREAGVDPLLY